MTYTLRFEFTRYQDANSVLNGAASAVLLVDSVRSIYFCQSFLTNAPFLTNASLSFQISLMPRHTSMEMFTAGDPASNSRKQNYERYRCHEGAKSVSRPLMSSTCSKLISSMSAVIHDGALRECLSGCFPSYWAVTFDLTHGLSVEGTGNVVLIS